eukprot:scaffold198740_cov28-Prasinocladus_malaysianus.AAC.1
MIVNWTRILSMCLACVMESILLARGTGGTSTSTVAHILARGLHNHSALSGDITGPQDTPIESTEKLQTSYASGSTQHLVHRQIVPLAAMDALQRSNYSHFEHDGRRPEKHSDLDTLTEHRDFLKRPNYSTDDQYNATTAGQENADNEGQRNYVNALHRIAGDDMEAAESATKPQAFTDAESIGTLADQVVAEQASKQLDSPGCAALFAGSDCRQPVKGLPSCLPTGPSKTNWFSLSRSSWKSFIGSAWGRSLGLKTKAEVRPIPHSTHTQTISQRQPINQLVSQSCYTSNKDYCILESQSPARQSVGQPACQPISQSLTQSAGWRPLSLFVYKSAKCFASHSLSRPAT